LGTLTTNTQGVDRIDTQPCTSTTLCTFNELALTLKSTSKAAGCKKPGKSQEFHVFLATDEGVQKN
jgi:hypothetical protein